MTTVKTQLGFTMVEQLIAFVVLAVGLLGMVNVQLSAQRLERSVMYETRALSLTKTLAEMMRTNPNGTTAGNYVAASTDTGVTHYCATGKGGQNCTPQQLAEHDIYLWKQALEDAARGLPNATGAIVGNGSAGVYTVTVTWQDLGDTVSHSSVIGGGRAKR